MEDDFHTALKQPLLQTGREVQQHPYGSTSTAIYCSLAGNVVLLVAKALAFWWSRSMAVLASLVDSVIDLFSQAVISLADWDMSRVDPRFPAGKARLETLSVLGCAAIMIGGAMQVITSSVTQLMEGLGAGKLPQIEMGPLMYWILGAATVLKFGLWYYCFLLRHRSVAALALAEDHLNDVVSNLGAIVTAAIASQCSQYWWADPLGGIGISCYIMLRWTVITKHQVDKIVGKTASQEFLDVLHELVSRHHPHTRAGHLRAYHSGQRLAVDVELAAPAHWSLAQLGPIAQELKRKIEAFSEVECAAVFIVHQASAAFVPAGVTALPPSAATEPHTSTAVLREEWVEGLGDLEKDQCGLWDDEPPGNAVVSSDGVGLGLAGQGPGRAWSEVGRVADVEQGELCGSAPLTGSAQDPYSLTAAPALVPTLGRRSRWEVRRNSSGPGTAAAAAAALERRDGPPAARQLAWSRCVLGDSSRSLQSGLGSTV